MESYVRSASEKNSHPTSVRQIQTTIHDNSIALHTQLGRARSAVSVRKLATTGMDTITHRADSPSRSKSADPVPRLSEDMCGDWSASAWLAGMPPDLHGGCNGGDESTPLGTSTRLSTPSSARSSGATLASPVRRKHAPSSGVSSAPPRARIAAPRAWGDSLPASPADAPSMPPPKETGRERRLQQQRDALTHGVAVAQVHIITHHILIVRTRVVTSAYLNRPPHLKLPYAASYYVLS